MFVEEKHISLSLSLCVCVCEREREREREHERDLKGCGISDVFISVIKWLSTYLIMHKVNIILYFMSMPNHTVKKHIDKKERN